MIKKYAVTMNDLPDFLLVVEIDEEKAAPAIREMVEFWAGWIKRLLDFDGDYTGLFLRQLAVEVYRLTAEFPGIGVEGVIDSFAANKEGWTPMNGE